MSSGEAGLRRRCGRGWTAPDQVLHLIVAGFAGWTVLVNLSVLGGGTLDILLSAAAIALLARWVLGRHLPLRESPVQDPPGAGSAQVAAAAAEPPRWLRIAVGSSALVLAVGFAATRELEPFWFGAVATLAVACGWELLWGRAERSTAPGEVLAHPSPREQAALWVLAATCAAITLILHRPDIDDAYYLSMAVAAADHPGTTLLAADPVHGVPNVPFSVFYKVHSIEILAAALARISPLRVLDAAHMAIPFAGGALVALAHARLLRLLVPGRWLWTTVAAVVLLLCLGDTLESYGNFAFVRLHQGKGIPLAAGIPLLVAFSIEFAARPTLRRWVRLFIAQVAALGLSSTALWLAPVTVTLAVASASGPTLRGLGTVLLGAASSAYLLGWAIGIRGAALAAFENIAPDLTSVERAASTLSQVLGTGAVAPLLLGVLVGGWSLATSRAHRSLASLYVLGFLLLAWNPYTANLVAAEIAGDPTYWRVFWLLPIAALVAAVLTRALEAIRPRAIGAALTCILLIALGLWAPAHHTWDEANHTRVDLPGWKAPVAEMRAAQLVTSHARPGSSVLVPLSVSPWLPTLHHHPNPLIVRWFYISLLQGYVDDAELFRRWKLSLLVSEDQGRRVDAGRNLAWGIEHFSLEVVCLAHPAAQQRGIRSALSQASFVRVGVVPGYEVWTRRDR